MRQALFLASQAHKFQHLGNLGFNRVTRLADHLHSQRNVFVNALRGQQAEVLEDGSHLTTEFWNRPARKLAHVVAKNPHGSRSRANLPHGELEERGLT